MKKKGLLFILLLLCSSTQHLFAAQVTQYQSRAVAPANASAYELRHCRRKNLDDSCVSRWFRNIGALHSKLLHWDTLKITCSIFPMYIAARMIDEDLQNCFYHKNHHKNVNQMPDCCHEIARLGTGIPIAILGSMAFFARKEELRTTSQVFLVGMPFVIFGKELIKKFRHDGCLRPWSEKFSCKERACGGFPSGHMAEISYMAVLYGMRYGVKAGFPLGLTAAMVGATFLSCNRHYLSQLIAGVGLGAMYAFAANKLIDSKLSGDYYVKMKVDKKGHAGVKFGCKF